MENTNLVQIIKHDDKRLVDARELHKALLVKTLFKDWFRNRIKEYKFIENIDFFRSSNFSYGDIQKVRNPNPKKDFFVTIDTAKELAIVERNEIGRKIRRYFIETEEKYRQIQWLGLPTVVLNDKILVNYKSTLRTLGYSIKSGAVNTRKRYNSEEFYKIFNQNFITITFALLLKKQAEIRQLQLNL